MSEEKHALGGKILTGPFLLLAVLACIGAYFIVTRMFFGLGAVTNLNGGYPWGIWIALDVVVGTALGCGGFSMALLIYILNRNVYSPLMRPALMASLFGYTLAGAAVMFDLGRYWHAYNLALPWYAQPNSVLFEVALCIGAYVIVLCIEIVPTFLDGFERPKMAKAIRRWMWLLMALGVLLPTMHQSSLGSLLLVLGSQLSPLWHTTWLPLLYLISAVAMGYGVVMLEATLVTNAFHLQSEQRILAKLSPIVATLMGAFLVIRFADIFYRGHAGLMFAGDIDGLLFLIETVIFLAATLLLASPQARRNQRLMFLAAVSLVAAGALYRINGYLVAYDPGNGWIYFPAVGELMVTIGIFSLEIMLYLIFIKKLPVLSGVRVAGTGQET
jgi:Ni/Fe-hydrogenase subunit HybB-like protein